MNLKQMLIMSANQSKFSDTSSCKLLRITYVSKDLVFDSTKLSREISTLRAINRNIFSLGVFFFGTLPLKKPPFLICSSCVFHKKQAKRFDILF